MPPTERICKEEEEEVLEKEGSKKRKRYIEGTKGENIVWHKATDLEQVIFGNVYKNGQKLPIFSLKTTFFKVFQWLQTIFSKV